MGHERTSQIRGISNGTKQGHTLAGNSTFLHFVRRDATTFVTFKNCDLSISIQSRADGSVFNLRRLQVRTKTTPALVRNLLYSDDCALFAHTLQRWHLSFCGG